VGCGLWATEQKNTNLHDFYFLFCFVFLFLGVQTDYLTLPCSACAIFDDSSAFSAVSQLLNVRVDRLAQDWELRRHFI
jgi:hypothetical protein